MVTLVAEHWFTAEFAGQAPGVFQQYTERLKQGEEFVSRQVLRSMSDPTKITTITTWKSEKGYREFLAQLETARAQQDPNPARVMLGEKLEAYEVITSI